jgi:hypothetical protein
MNVWRIIFLDDTPLPLNLSVRVPDSPTETFAKFAFRVCVCGPQLAACLPRIVSPHNTFPVVGRDTYPISHFSASALGPLVIALYVHSARFPCVGHLIGTLQGSALQEGGKLS